MDSGLKLEMITGPSNAVDASPAIVASTASSRSGLKSGSPGTFLISMSAAARPERTSSASCKVGTPAAPPPASSIRSRRTCSSVIDRTSPLPSVVRATSASCMTTATPSDVMRTSNSTASAPSSIAASKASTVFSATRAESPRWATTTP